MRKPLALPLLLTPSLALASGYSVLNTSPRDLGLCASSVAAQRDAGAAFALPAALARIAGPSARAGGGAVNVFDDWTDPAPGATAARTTDPTEPGAAYLNLQFAGFPNIAVSYGGKLPLLGNRSFGLGLGLQPFGGAAVSWPDGWAGRYRVQEVNRQVASGIASAGIEVTPRIRLGGGLVYYYTMEKLTQKIWMEPYPVGSGTPGAPDATARLDLSGGGFTYSVSAEVEPLRGIPLTLAVDYKHKSTQRLDGDVAWTGTEPYFEGTQFAELTALFTAKKAKQTLTIPNLLNVGAAYRAMKPLLVTATFTFDRWVVYESDSFTADTGARIDVPRNYRNGQTYRIGAEYDLAPTLQVRAGVQRDVSGLRSAYYSPSLPDGSSWGGSLGATYSFARGVYADVALFYANMDRVSVPPSAGTEPGGSGTTAYTKEYLFGAGAFRGSYEPKALVYGLSVGWTPGARRSG